MAATYFEETDTRLWCSSCGECKDPSAFWPDPSRSRGYRAWCKDCDSRDSKMRRLRRLVNSRTKAAQSGPARV